MRVPTENEESAEIVSEPASDLARRSCRPDAKALAQPDVQKYLDQLDRWWHSNGEISKTYTFKDYCETVSFVNAVVWIAHREDHHPDIKFGYKTCQVSYSTHSAGGVTENDFICAAKVDELLKHS